MARTARIERKTAETEIQVELDLDGDGSVTVADDGSFEILLSREQPAKGNWLKISDGALAPWRKGKSPYFLQTIEAIARHYDFDKNTKWKDLPENVKEVFLRGSGEEEILFRFDEGGRVYQVTRPFEGVIPNMERRYRETESDYIRTELEKYMVERHRAGIPEDQILQQDLYR